MRSQPPGIEPPRPTLVMLFAAGQPLVASALRGRMQWSRTMSALWGDRSVESGVVLELRNSALTGHFVSRALPRIWCGQQGARRPPSVTSSKSFTKSQTVESGELSSSRGSCIMTDINFIQWNHHHIGRPGPSQAQTCRPSAANRAPSESGHSKERRGIRVLGIAYGRAVRVGP